MRAKTAGRLAGLTWLVVAFVFANTTGPLAVTPAGATDVRKTNTSSAFVAARNQAQSYLDRFYAFATSSAALPSTRPRVQVAFNGANVWADPIAKTPQGYSAALFEESDAGEVGEVIEFQKENVVDWHFIGPSKLFYGEFHLRARMARLSREDAGIIGVQLTEAPVPPGW